MKRFVFITLSFLLINQCLLLAQGNVVKTKNSKIGITYSSFGSNQVFIFQQLDGAANYDSDSFHTFGINYILGINKWLEAETGIEYSKHNILINPNIPPSLLKSQRKGDFSLINIPITLRANFWNYFYANGGILVDVDVSKHSPIDNQTGIGMLLGLGIKYDFHSGVSVFVNPYSKAHSLIPFQDTHYHQRVLENGIRFGVMYKLSK